MLALHKCHVGYHSIQLLGQKVSQLGLSTNVEKIQAVTTLATPHHCKDLETFLGMAIYFATYIPCFSGITMPLFIRLVSHIALAQKEYHFDVLSWPERLKLGLMSNDDQKLNFDLILMVLTSNLTSTIVNGLNFKDLTIFSSRQGLYALMNNNSSTLIFTIYEGAIYECNKTKVFYFIILL
ncbi:hypothetical protein BS47DRAFT_1307739 [Hydnum rufescens UP504]|uniref:Reverse transcriptase domain-containing protein n=1 Tax=Hydnum rufescens UP504 TaxID=1448309 RepID=A0A9P6AF41_9AGAM|nr:hypothetical protein BS47DRAFT_1307739 [Hydnum rufescens UP504]